MKFNKLKLVGLLLGMVLITVSCEDGLADVNIDPNASQEMTYGAQLLYCQLELSGNFHQSSRGLLTQAAGFIQHAASDKVREEFPGGKYYDIDIITDATWISEYPGLIKNIVDLVSRTSENPEDVNYNAIARILKVFAFHRLTDQYGDIPYLEAGGGVLLENVLPAYDSQESIYKHMLGELEASAAALTASKPTYGSGDNYYSGDIAKWKKYAYSLMLRLGMRMSEIDAGSAQSWVNKAIAGGVFTSNEDNAISTHDALRANGTSRAFNSNNFYKLSATLVDFLRDSNDPRLEMYGTVREGGGPQKGLPNDLDATVLSNLTAPDNNIETYSTFRTKIIELGAPMIYISYAEMLLLQAEAAKRTWTSGDAESLYNAAVHAGITQWSIYGIAIPDTATIDAYLANRPYNDANGLEMIGREYWVTTYMNWYETWSNWRRTGYPMLTPVNYDGAGANVPGIIPTRFSYPDLEYSLNVESIQTAVSRLKSGEKDDFNATVWWDVSQTN